MDRLRFSPQPKERIPADVTIQLLLLLQSEADRSSAALVCRAWYRYITLIHYPEIAIRNRAGLNLLLSQSMHSERIRRRLLFTRTLQIIDQWTGDGIPYCHSALLAMGTRIRALQNLQLHGSLRRPMHHSLPLALSLFRDVTRLQLDAFRLASFGDLQRIICAFPRLRALVLSRGFIADENDEMMDQPLNLQEPSPIALGVVPLRWQMKHLRSLEIRFLGPRLLIGLINWLVGTSQCKGIQDLTVTMRSATFEQTKMQFLRKSEASLYEVSLHGESTAENTFTLSLYCTPAGVDLHADVRSGTIAFEWIKRLPRARHERQWWTILSTVQALGMREPQLGILCILLEAWSDDHIRAISDFRSASATTRFNHSIPSCQFGGQCGYPINNVLECRQHIEKAHLDLFSPQRPDGNVHCHWMVGVKEQCAEIYTPMSLPMHIAMVHIPRSYICEHCGKGFSRPQGLARHKLARCERR